MGILFGNASSRYSKKFNRILRLSSRKSIVNNNEVIDEPGGSEESKHIRGQSSGDGLHEKENKNNKLGISIKGKPF